MNYFRRLLKPKHASTANICEVTDLHSNIGQQVLTIYEQSFPEAKRDPLENIAASLNYTTDTTEITHLRALMEQETVVGFAYFSSYREYYLGFLKFIAVRADIEPKVRPAPPARCHSAVTCRWNTRHRMALSGPGI